MPKARKTRDCDSSMNEMSGEPAKRRKTDSAGVKTSKSVIESELKSSSQRPKTRSTDPGPSSKEKHETQCDTASDLEGTWLSSEAPESSSQKIPEPVVKLEAKNETDFVSDEKEFEFSACVADEKRTLTEQTESEFSVKESSSVDFLVENERKETGGNQVKEDGKESIKAFIFLNKRGIICSAPGNKPQRQDSSRNQEKYDRPKSTTTDPGPSSEENYEPSCGSAADLEFKQGSFEVPETSSKALSVLKLEAKNVADIELEKKEFESSACAANEETIVAEQTTIESGERERRDVDFLDENKAKVTCESRIKAEGEKEETLKACIVQLERLHIPCSVPVSMLQSEGNSGKLEKSETGERKPKPITLRRGKHVASRGKQLPYMFRNIIQREEKVESEKVAEAEANEMQMESAATGTDENVVKKTVHETCQCIKANRIAIILAKDDISSEEESKVWGTDPNPGNREVKKTAFSVNDTTVENVSQMQPTECHKSEENVDFTKIDRRPFTRSSVRNSDTQKSSQANARQKNATCKRKASDHGKNAKVKERRSNDLVRRSERLSQKIMRKTVEIRSLAIEKENESKTETLSSPSREYVRETGGKPRNLSENLERAKTKKAELKTTLKTSGSEVRGKKVKEVARGKKKPPSDVIPSCSVDSEISDSSSDSSSSGSSSRSSNTSSSKSYSSATESSSDSEGEHLASSMLEQNERLHLGQHSSV